MHSSRREPAPGWSRSRAYARWFRSPLGRAYGASIERAIQPWLAGVEGSTVLDAGCGPILAFVHLVSLDARLIALDCSFEMARGARERLDALGRRGWALCGSAERIPLPDATAELVLSLNCLEFVSDPARAAAELFRAAAPGARAVIGVLNRASPWELTRRLGRLVARPGPYYAGRFFTATELAALLEGAGWRIDEIARAARFPPLPLPRPSWYRALEPLVPRGRSALLLARAHRPGGPFFAKRDEVEPGEDPLAVARRELAEETGWRSPQEGFLPLGEIRQKGGKRVAAWAFEGDFDPAALESNTFELDWPPGSGGRASFPEVDQAAWFDLGEARRRILPAQAPLLERLAAAVGGSGED